MRQYRKGDLRDIPASDLFSKEGEAAAPPIGNDPVIRKLRDVDPADFVKSLIVEIDSHGLTPGQRDLLEEALGWGCGGSHDV